MPGDLGGKAIKIIIISSDGPVEFGPIYPRGANSQMGRLIV